MSLCFKLVDEPGHKVLIQELRFVNVVPLIETPDELIAANGDLVRSGIGDRDVANPLIIEFDLGPTSLQMAKSRGHDRDHVGGIGIDESSVLGPDGGCGERTNGSFSCGHQLVLDVRNGEDLLGFGIIAHAERID